MHSTPKRVKSALGSTMVRGIGARARGDLSSRKGHYRQHGTYHLYPPSTAGGHFTPSVTYRFIINDTYRSEICLLYPPHMIAIAAIYLTLVLNDKTREIGRASCRERVFNWV